MADIFISYAREDGKQAERLAKALREQGFEVWRDIESLRSGVSFSASIQQALEEAGRVVVLWSATSVASRWVDAEALWAWERGKLHSVWLDDKVAVRVPFNASHARTLANWDGGSDYPELRRLVADIAVFVQPHGSEGPAPAGPGQPEPTPVLPQEPKHSPTAPAEHPGEAKRASAPSAEPKTPTAPAAAQSTSSASDGKPGPRAGWRLPRPVMVGGLVLLVGVGVLVGALVFFPEEPPEVTPEQPPVSESTPEPSKASTPSDQAALSREPGETFQDCPECPEMIVIPAGTFQMGSAEGQGYDDERPRHEVRIGKPFAIGKHEVTFDQWDACFQAGNCKYNPEDQGWGRGSRPVINVSWQDAQEYVGWLSGKTGKSYRLPTEAEWEYAARAGTETPYSTGACIDTEQANYNGNYGGDCPKTGVFREQTVEVGTFAPNPWGLHEVHGNVLEWVQDCWHESYEGAPGDGSAWESGDCDHRVLRGGTWYFNPWNLRSADRYRNRPGGRYGLVGFRVAQDIP